MKEVIGNFPDDSSDVFAGPRTGKPFRNKRTSFDKAMEKMGLMVFTFHMLSHAWFSRVSKLGIAETSI